MEIPRKRLLALVSFLAMIKSQSAENLMKKEGAWLSLKLLDLLLCSTAAELLRGQYNGKRVPFSCTRSALRINLTTRISEVWREDYMLCSLESVACSVMIWTALSAGAMSSGSKTHLWHVSYSAWIRQCIKRRDSVWCLDFVGNSRYDTSQSSVSCKSLQGMEQALDDKILKRDWNPIFRKDPCIQEINSRRN